MDIVTQMHILDSLIKFKHIALSTYIIIIIIIIVIIIIGEAERNSN